MPFHWRGKYVCFFCGTDVGNYHALKEHTRTHIPCSQSDRNLKMIKRDSEIKIDVSNIVCNVCTNMFSNIDDVIPHLVWEHNIPYDINVPAMLSTYSLNDLKCLLCEKNFKIFDVLIRHINDCHLENHFACDVCHHVFTKKRGLRNHIRMHLSDVKKELKCEFCSKTFFKQDYLLKHEAKCNLKLQIKGASAVVDLRTSVAHFINMTNAVPFKYFRNKFTCFYCPKSFTICSDLRDHVTTKHPTCYPTSKALKLRGRSKGVKIKIDIALLCCKLCPVKFDNFLACVHHLEMEHKTFIMNSIEVLQPFTLIHDRFPCPVCSVEFRYFGLLLKHVCANHSSRDYICPVCGRSFHVYNNMRSHISRTHSLNINSLKCSDCNSGFSTTYSLRIHMGAVHGRKVINCQQCSEKFVSQYQMVKHKLKVHGAGHKCTYCDRVFIKYSYMINHVRKLHDKEKNVQCTMCGLRFFDATRLRMHMVSHGGDRLFGCDICAKKFLRKKNLRGHMDCHIKMFKESMIS